MDFSIREFNKDDFPAWSKLWRGYLDFYDSEVAEHVYESSWQRLLSEEPNEFKGLAAVSNDGRMLGITHYLFHRHGWKIEDVCYLQDLYVEDDARGLGVGRALIEAVYAHADDHGCSQVYWLTQEDNASARVLYDRVADLTSFIKYQRNFDNKK